MKIMVVGSSGYIGRYLVKSLNGLVVCLSGDTGHTSDMATIVNDYYGGVTMQFDPHGKCGSGC